jgi:glycosyltransferase involved in cell wall biosynthesis
LGCEIVDDLRIPAITASAGPISHADVLNQMRQSAVSLYVTLSECMPMVPLESISEGAPCIVGPGTELFTDDPALADLLVVKDPNDPVSIRQALTSVLDKHDDVSRQCADYLEVLNARSASDIAHFLE